MKRVYSNPLTPEELKELGINFEPDYEDKSYQLSFHEFQLLDEDPRATPYESDIETISRIEGDRI